MDPGSSAISGGDGKETERGLLGRGLSSSGFVLAPPFSIGDSSRSLKAASRLDAELAELRVAC